MIKRLSRLSRDNSGSALAEFAIITPMIVTMLLAVFEFGTALLSKSVLLRATSDITEIAANYPAGRLDNWTPVTQDLADAPSIFEREINNVGSDLTIQIDEVTATQNGTIARILSQSGDQSVCALDATPNFATLGLRSGERMAVVRTCMHWLSPLGVIIPGRHMTVTRTLPMTYSLPASCSDLLALGQKHDGIYTIDPDGAGPHAPFQARCDMTEGGWTLVAAQFERSAVSWNSGLSANYDPTLQSGNSFALAAGDLPPHSITGFGLNERAGSLAAFQMSYAPDQTTDLPSITSLQGDDYAIYRADDYHYEQLPPSAPPILDPESAVKTTAHDQWNACLVVDRNDTVGRDWWFCPNATSPSDRGAAYGGSDRTGAADASAWTIWIR